MSQQVMTKPQLEPAVQPRARKHLRALRWRASVVTGDHEWTSDDELRIGLEQLLDSDSKRAEAVNLVRSWHALPAGDRQGATLSEIRTIPAGLLKSERVSQLLNAATELAARANATASACADPAIRALCAELAANCHHDVARIRRSLLWAEGE